MHIKRPKILVLVFSKGFLLSLFSIGSVHAENFIVDSVLDEVDINVTDGICQTVSNTCTLRAAIQQANALGGKDSIQLESTTYRLTLSGARENKALTGDLDITEDVEIFGTGSQLTIIDANSLDRIFHIFSGSNISIQNLSLINSQAVNENGGAILVEAANVDAPSAHSVNLHNMVIKNSKSLNGDGGAIYFNSRGYLMLQNIDLLDNSAKSGGGLFIGAGVANINNSRIERNNAIATGGGIHSSNDILLINSQIVENTAGSSGGGINATGTLRIKSSKIASNIAGVTSLVQGNGGGIYLNLAASLNIDDSELLNNSTARSGGGLAVSSALTNAVLSISRTLIHNNIAGFNGGGIDAKDLDSIANSSVRANQAGLRGGGVHLTGLSKTMKISYSLVADNIVNNKGTTSVNYAVGGGIALSRGNVEIENTTITNNTVDNIKPGFTIGGGLFLAASRVNSAKLINNTIANNVSRDDAGNISTRLFSGKLLLVNNIIAGLPGVNNCEKKLSSNGNNIDSDGSCLLTGPNDLSSVEPQVGLLALHGGSTDTMPPLMGSPAISGGSINDCPAKDQRFYIRSTLSCDIGAHESGGTIGSAGLLQLVQGVAAVGESDGIAQISVERILGSAGDVSVRYQTLDQSANSSLNADYSAESGVLTWLDGETGPKTLSIPIINDTVAEIEEQFSVRLFDPSDGSKIQGAENLIVRIMDDDLTTGPIRFEKASIIIDETQSTVVANIERPLLSSGNAASIDYQLVGVSARPGLDYQDSIATVSFSPGSRRESIIIELFDDLIYETTETLQLQLVNPQGGAQLPSPSPTLELSIVDNETTAATGTINFTQANHDVGEAAGTNAITVQRTLGSTGYTTVDYVVSGGTAEGGVDYLIDEGTLIFADGVTKQQISVDILDDSLVEAEESIILSLSNIAGGAELGQITSTTMHIIDNDKPTTIPGVVQYVLATETVNENVGMLNIAVERNGGSSGSVSVDYSVLNGTATINEDYIISEGTLTFANGETFKNFSISIVDDSTFEPNETVVLSLSRPTNGAALGIQRETTITIVSDDPEPPVLSSVLTFATTTQTVDEGVGGMNIRVLRTNATNGEVRVNFVVVPQSGSGEAMYWVDYQLVEGTLVFADGVTSVNVPIAIVDDFEIEDPETFTLELVSVSAGATIGSDNRITITISDNDSSIFP